MWNNNKDFVWGIVTVIHLQNIFVVDIFFTGINFFEEIVVDIIVPGYYYFRVSKSLA